VVPRPGEVVTLPLTIEARLRAGEALGVALRGPAAGTGVRYDVAARAGTFHGIAVVATLAGTGVHRVPVTLTLPADAPGPVSFPLSAAPAHPAGALLAAR
jgi:hypothetical protein